MNEQNNKPSNSEKQQNHHGNRRRNHHGKPYYMNEKPKNAEATANQPSQKQEQAVAPRKNEDKNKQGQNQQHRQGQNDRQNRRQNQQEQGDRQNRRQNQQEQDDRQSRQQNQQNQNNQERRNRNRNRRHDKRKQENNLQKPENNQLEQALRLTEEPVAEINEETILSPVGEFEPNPLTSDDNTPEISISIDTPEEEAATVTVSGIRFKSGGKVYYFEKGELEPKNGSYVIVETARGAEFGEVAFANKKIRESTIVLPLRPILRLATAEDIEHHKENKRLEEEAFGICLEKIKKHKLDMKLIDVQYSFDNSKLLFYFTSASRVDFRELVKDLASVFKTRIELRQIGIRDEAKIMGGLGVCGRSLCCSTFLSDFAQVSIKMAKEQNLSLNSGKISGVCGRLMCCLQYEYSTYLDEAARTPSVDSTVKTKDGVGVVIEAVPLAAKVKVKLKDKPDSPPQYYHRNEVTVISKGSKKDSD